jgi:hypothetical protein
MDVLACPRYARDGDPPGVRAAWSPGAVTGQRGSVSSGWPRRRDPVSGARAGGGRCLLGVARADPLGAAL